MVRTAWLLKCRAEPGCLATGKCPSPRGMLAEAAGSSWAHGPSGGAAWPGNAVGGGGGRGNEGTVPGLGGLGPRAEEAPPSAVLCTKHPTPKILTLLPLMLLSSTELFTGPLCPAYLAVCIMAVSAQKHGPPGSLKPDGSPRLVRSGVPQSPLPPEHTCWPRSTVLYS